MNEKKVKSLRKAVMEFAHKNKVPLWIANGIYKRAKKLYQTIPWNKRQQFMSTLKVDAINS